MWTSPFLWMRITARRAVMGRPFCQAGSTPAKSVYLGDKFKRRIQIQRKSLLKLTLLEVNMKNIVAILKDLGYEVPADQEQAVIKAVAESYVTISEHDKKIGRLEAERDQYKDQLGDAQKTLQSFDGIDPAKYKEELDGYKKRAEDSERTYKNELSKRDRNDLIEKELEKIQFSSKYAKASILQKIKDDEDIRVKDGKLIGFNDLINSYRESDPDAFGGDNKPAKFTTPNKDAGGKPVTKESIMAMTDTHARRKAMAENYELFEE